MKAIRVAAYGGPESLELQDIEEPPVGDEEVLIDVASTSVNPVDWKIVTGMMKGFIPLPLPFTPGVDVAGTVAALGRNVTGLAVGAEVFGFIGITGGYATRAVSSADRLALKPKNVGFLEAGGIPATALTAWQALHEHGGLRAGQRVLIHGAAGGVGSVAVQLARIAGAEVIATASARNLEYVKSLGASTVIDYAANDFERNASDVDIVLDLVGGDTQTRSWSVLRRGGTLVSTVSLPDASRGADVGAIGKRFATRPDGEQLSVLASLYESGQLRTEIDSVYPLVRAGEALAKSMAGHVRGKVIIQATN
ncbi:NADP-dependent oxidoreductase [Burkholderia sp. WSM2232]|uniref:NADP-dependent oxidoreductase n=1 Tax=Burkholderia sp. WSM2232 TaxID=944436 RepID=UPI0004052F13|nr:NADP-dependent oxidoreductase [Burkholderia sp. WSM2232]